MSKKMKILKRKQIIVALDYDSFKEANSISKLLDPEIYRLKIGKQLFTAEGPKIIENFNKQGFDIFLDLKLHDIPNTVKGGLRAIKKLAPLLTTIHISGGDEMMKASIKSKKNTKILGVSVLTSLDNKQTEIYYNENNIELLVKKLAKKAKLNKLDGIVCSPKEIKFVRKALGKKFLIVTPGIRPKKNNKKDDQKRTLSPLEAIKRGANLLVIGRPITMSKNPLKILKEINNSLI